MDRIGLEGFYFTEKTNHAYWIVGWVLRNLLVKLDFLIIDINIIAIRAAYM